MNYKRTVTIILGVALMLTSLASAIPVLDVRYDISDEEFEAMTFTNPDSMNAFEEADMPEKFGVNHDAVKKTVVSPGRKYLTSEGEDEYGFSDLYMFMGDEQLYPITESAKGPYPTAFSPDGEMYVSYNNAKSDTQFEITIHSSETGRTLIGEYVDYFADSLSAYSTELPYDRSSMFEFYWTADGANIVVDVSCGYSSDPSSAVGDVLVMKHNVLNVDYNELQRLNGGSASPVVTQEEPQQLDLDDNAGTSILSTDTEESPTSSDTTPSTPAFTFSFALTAFVAGRQFSKKK